MLKSIFIIISVLLTAIFFISCDDRGVVMENNDYLQGLVFDNQHLFADQLGNSMFDLIQAYPLIPFKVYVPYGYKDQNAGTPYPVLYLMSPFKGDAFFYFSHGLKDLADRMIAKGEIQPMIIVCVDGSNGYGGSFYGNSYAGGRYADIFGNILGSPVTGSIIDYVDEYYNTIPERSCRAIGGVEMGGYGAMRIAIEYNENFSAASAVSAPLDFDGADGDGGFVPYFEQIIDEMGGSSHYYSGLDSAAAYPIWASETHPFWLALLAAATSFSPNDTGAIDANVIIDSVTFFEPSGHSGSLKFHMPFDSTGAPYEPIWDLWLDNNVPNMLANNPTSLDSTDLLLIGNPGADYGYYQQTVDFHSDLTTLGKAHEYYEFSGYEGNPATRYQYTYDMLAKILKFHSDKFILP
jgi:S-formylglutathione hydrolase FrmB